MSISSRWDKMSFKERQDRRESREAHAKDNAAIQNLALAAGGNAPPCGDQGPDAVQARSEAETARRKQRRAISPKIPKVRRKRKSARKALVAKLDRAFSVWVRTRDAVTFGGKCSLCQARPIEEAAHLISRGKHSVRWDPANAYAQCRGCNLRHEYHPAYYTNWWVNRHGIAAYNDLFRRSNEIAKFSREDLEAMIAKFNTEAPK